MKFNKAIACIFIISSFLISQDEKEGEGVSTSGSMGSVTIDGKIYNQMALRPEIPIGKLGLGLDVYIYFNDEGIYDENWDFSSGKSIYETLIDKIYFVRWGKPGDNLFFKAGALPNATLGQGILVNNYSNIMEYPEVRQTGLDFKMKFMKIFGVEFIHSNFKQAKPGVMAGRFFYTPVSRIEIGLSYASDANQYAGLKDSDSDNVPDVLDDFPDDENFQLDSDGDGLADGDSLEFDIDGDGLDYPEADSLWAEFEEFSDMFGFVIVTDTVGTNLKKKFDLTEEISPISALAFDLTFKLTKTMAIYGQYATLNGEEFMLADSTLASPGWGFSFPGFFMKVGPLNFRAEYRQSSDHFLFNYWDQAYDLTRATISGDVISTKSDQLAQYTALKGVYGDISANIMDVLWLNMGYQNLTSSDAESEGNGTLLGIVKLNTRKIPKLDKAEAFYQQSNVDDPFAFEPTESSISGYDLGFEVSEGMSLVYKSRTTYEKDANGEISPISSMQNETQIKF